MSTGVLMVIFWILVIVIGGLGANLLHDFLDCLIYCIKHKKNNGENEQRKED